MKRVPLGLSLVAAVGATGLCLSGTAAAASVTRTMDIAVDGQAYVADPQATNPSDGSVIDPYGGDPSVIHVAMHGGTEQARSFAHVALDYLPRQATAKQVTFVAQVAGKTDASKNGVYDTYNVNVESAIVQACALTKPFPAQFDRDNPPAYDCEHGSAIGKPNDDRSEWTFRLSSLLPYWRANGNTGFALVPIGDDAGATWSVSFTKPKTAASVVYTVPKSVAQAAGASPPAAPPVSSGTSGNTGGSTPSTSSANSGPAYVPPAANVPQQAASTTTQAPPADQSPAVADAQQAPATTPVAATPADDGGTGAWPWVLVASLAVAAGAVGVAHRAAVAGFLARVVPPGLAAFRAHPRAYSVASAALAWGLVFTSYSLVTQPDGVRGEQLAGSQPSTSTPGSAAPTAPGSAAPSTALNGGGSAPAPASGSGAGGTTIAAGSETTSAGGSVSPSSPVADAKTEFEGRGQWRTINGIRVFFPADGGTPVADLYRGADDVIGLTPDSIRICTHAALTYGPAFDIDKEDINVYWDYVNDELGGVFGRQVKTEYYNDDYDPGKAVTAAQACKDWGTFVLLGGIGFDQIPAVRQWAEQNRQLYIHHVASIQGTSGQRFSFSALPSVEQAGTAMGQLAIKKFSGKKIGVIYRASTNWQPGYELFKQTVEKAGMDIVGEYGTNVNQGNYTQEITQLRSKGAEVIFAWENAVAATEMIKQAQGQDYHPAWLLFPFNLTTWTLDQDHSAMDQDIWGLSVWDAYDPGYYGGGFAPYADQIKEFERQYRKYDPNANLNGSRW